MKYNNIILTSVGLVSLGFSQVTPQVSSLVTSDVVGYETLNKQIGFNYFGLRLVEDSIFRGTVGAVSGATITLDREVSVSTNSHLVEITSGLAEGTVIEITNGSGLNITIQEDLSNEVFPGDTVTIRPVQTLASIFGANNNQSLVSGVSYAGSDQIWVPNRGGDFNKYAYLQAGFSGQEEGWYSSLDDGATINLINPEEIKLNYIDGIIINSRSVGEIIVYGNVKLTPTSIAITTDFTYIGTNYPAGATLDTVLVNASTSNLESSSSFGGSDQLLIPDGDGGLNKYAYLQSGFLGQSEGWYTSEDGINITAVNGSEVELSSGLIISRGSDIDKNITLSVPETYNNF